MREIVPEVDPMLISLLISLEAQSDVRLYAENYLGKSARVSIDRSPLAVQAEIKHFYS
jgi:hypothetical protein